MLVDCLMHRINAAPQISIGIGELRSTHCVTCTTHGLFFVSEGFIYLQKKSAGVS